MRRNKVNKWAWRKRLRFSIQHHFLCSTVPLSGVSAVYDEVSAYRKRFALERASLLRVHDVIEVTSVSQSVKSHMVTWKNWAQSVRVILRLHCYICVICN